MLNQIILIGRLTENPGLNYTNSGTPVVNFNLAVKRNSGDNEQNSNNQQDVDFIPIVAWERKAEVVAEYLSKGRLIAVSGRLKLEKNETEEFTYINPKVTAYNIQFLYSQNSSDNAERKSNNESGPNGESGVPETYNNNVGNPGPNSADDIQVPF